MIVRSEIHEQELKELTRSADRAGYFIYKNNRRELDEVMSKTSDWLKIILE